MPSSVSSITTTSMLSLKVFWYPPSRPTTPGRPGRILNCGGQTAESVNTAPLPVPDDRHGSSGKSIRSRRGPSPSECSTRTDPAFGSSVLRRRGPGTPRSSLRRRPTTSCCAASRTRRSRSACGPRNRSQVEVADRVTRHLLAAEQHFLRSVPERTLVAGADVRLRHPAPPARVDGQRSRAPGPGDQRALSERRCVRTAAATPLTSGLAGVRSPAARTGAAPPLSRCRHQHRAGESTADVA